MHDGRWTGSARRTAGGGGGPLPNWFWFLCALALLRTAFLLAALDPEEERVATVIAPTGQAWSGGPDRPLFDREELYAGTAAEAIRRDFGLPLTTYRFTPYGSGSLLISLAAVPLYTLFGPGYLAFKILPLLIALAGGLCWFQLVKAWLGARIAAFFGLIYLLAPSVLVRTTLIAKGDHAEAMAWIGFVLLLATWAARIPLDGPEAVQGTGGFRGRREIRPFLAGLAAGFGVFITYSTIPVLAGIGMAALLRTRARPRRLWAFFGIGVLAGLLPWFATLASVGGEGLRIYGRPVTRTGEVSVVLERIGLLFNQGFLAGFDLPGGTLTRTPAALIWLGSVTTGAVLLVRKRRGPLSILILAGVGAHLLAYCVFAPDASSRYLLPVYPLLILLSVLPLDPAHTGRVASWRWAGPGLVSALGLFATLWVIGSSGFTCLRAPLSGLDWPLLGEIVGAKIAPEQIVTLPAPYREYFWAGLGRRAFRQLPPEEWASAAGLAGSDAARVWQGIGIGVVETDLLRPGAAAAASQVLSRLPQPERGGLLAGLLLYSEEYFAPLAARGGLAAGAAFVASFPEAERPELRRSLARVSAILVTHGVGKLPSTEEVRTTLAPSEAEDAAGWALYRGGAGRRDLRWWQSPARAWTGRSREESRAAGREDFWRGAASAFEWDLGTRSASWVRDQAGRSGPPAFVRELNPDQAVFFARAQSRAAREEGSP